MARYQEQQTHCKKGHPFDDKNTYVDPSTGYRNCRACHSEREAERRSLIPRETYHDRRVRVFWSRVSKSDDCWEWTAGRSTTGYGRFSYVGQSINAHRFVYEVVVGPIPKDGFVCHHCDNTGCVNPDHLFLGTAADNSADMVQKGRAARNANPRYGTDNSSAKLDPEKVREMRRLRFDDEWEYRPIAAKFGVTPRAAWSAINRKTWAHIP